MSELNLSKPKKSSEDKIRAGDSVKLNFLGKEKLWVEVTQVSMDGQFKGKIDDDPCVIVDDVEFGQEITFGKDDVYEVLS